MEETFTGVQGWWVGLSDLGHEGEWVWQVRMSYSSFYSHLQFTREDANNLPWDTNYPDVQTPNSKDCAALVSNSVKDRATYAAYLRDISCSEAPRDYKVAPICQRGGLDNSAGTTPATTTTIECPGGWVQYDADYGVRKCFQYSTSERRADSAEVDCVSKGGHLASIHSQAEQDFLFSNLNNRGENVWVGGVDINHNRAWGWTDGTPFDFANWGADDPDGGAYYMYLMASDYFNMYDAALSDYNYYICQLS